MTRLLTAALVLAVTAAAALGMADRAASHPTALQVAAIGAPQRIHGSDGREHIAYDLVITNAFTGEATLSSLVVRGGGKRLLTLSGEVLAAAIRPFGGGGPTTSIPVSSSIVAYVDVVLPHAAGRTVPQRVHNRVSYSLPSGAPVEAIIGSRTVRAPDLRVDRRQPIVIAPRCAGPAGLPRTGAATPS